MSYLLTEYTGSNTVWGGRSFPIRHGERVGVVDQLAGTECRHAAQALIAFHAGTAAVRKVNGAVDNAQHGHISAASGG